MNKNDILSIEIRRIIYRYIKNNPGVHLRKISRDLNIPLATLNYHTRFLKKHDLLNSNSKGRYVRFYIPKNLSYKYKKYLDFLRNNTTRDIILFILSWTVTSRKEISKELELHPNTIASHLKKLIDKNIIEAAPIKNGYFFYYIQEDVQGKVKRNPQGREIFYRLASPAIFQIMDAFIIYKNSLFDNIAYKTIIDTIHENTKYGDFPRKIDEADTAIDKVIKVVFDLFPNPFCA